MLLKTFRFQLIIVMMVAVTGCKKLVDVEPPITRVVSEVVFTTNETSIAVVNGIYAQIANKTPLERGLASLSGTLGLSADELAILPTETRGTLFAYYRNQLAVNPVLFPNDFWATIYAPFVGQVNTAIDGLASAATFEEDNVKSSLNNVVRRQLLGEMYFMRAFCYFYLAELYGDVPLLLTSDYVVNSTSGRTAKATVYQQMVKDLLLAEENLYASYPSVDLLSAGDNNPRIRPVKAAAQALLARVYLYTNNPALAEQYALKVIRNPLFKLEGLDAPFLANSKEALWQLQPVILGRNTQEAWTFKLPATGPTNVTNRNPVFLNPALVNAFEIGDNRRKNWVDSVIARGVTYYYPNKYKSATLNAPVTEYSTVMRLAEQLLIGAEARAKLGNLQGADSMLNAIRNRAGLPDVASGSQESLMSVIVHERQVELFTEWGHRWLDLKRTGMIDKVMEKVTPQKGGGAWQSYQQWFPIPVSEFLYNAALAGQQNTGY